MASRHVGKPIYEFIDGIAEILFVAHFAFLIDEAIKPDRGFSPGYAFVVVMALYVESENFIIFPAASYFHFAFLISCREDLFRIGRGLQIRLWLFRRLCLIGLSNTFR